MPVKTQRTCENGHRYFKSSDCPVCPICARQSRPDSGFLSLLSAPARRALENHGIVSLEKLARYTKAEILDFHGMGPSSLSKLKVALREAGLGFKA